ncbi:zinc finger protein 14 [Elysia marginata]|uniref:Zinc finger protein 14 n=1 Tax=Elysia marginata TaxID=1093978 RepID=A0AAV4F600_9GAST|nr:zinc finger protein 14 [Elysia marginata]
MPYLRGKRTTNLGTGDYYCDTCGRSFLYKRSLTRHKWKCDQSRVLNCFSNNAADLMLSGRRDTISCGTGDFYCDKCGHRFSYRQSLTRHKWRCDQSRVLNCIADVVGAGHGVREGNPQVFETGSLSTRGRASNTLTEDERTLTCGTCQKTFTFLQSLRRHKWKCEGTRVMACDICHKCFYRRDKLKSHLLSQHGIHLL